MSEELLLPGKIYRDSALNRKCLILSGSVKGIKEKNGYFTWQVFERKYGKRTPVPFWKKV